MTHHIASHSGGMNVVLDESDLCFFLEVGRTVEQPHLLRCRDRQTGPAPAEPTTDNA